MNAKITLWGMNEYYKTEHPTKDIFEKWTLPTSLASVKNDITDYILMNCGEFEMLWNDIEFFAEALCVFGKTYYKTFDRWAETLNKEYNPIENYDRRESWSDTSQSAKRATDVDSSESKVNSATTEQSSNIGTVENKVSGFDSASYSDKDFSEQRAGNNASSGTQGSTQNSGNREQNEAANDSSEHTGRMHGNIGVTTSATMITEEMAMRLKETLYKKICDVFCAEFAIMVY